MRKVLLLGLLALTACSETVPKKDSLLGVWRWKTAEYPCDTKPYVCQYQGTFTFEPSEKDRNYLVHYVVQKRYAIGTSQQSQVGAEQDCKGVLDEDRLSIVCTVDRKAYPDWFPAEFSFKYSPGSAQVDGLFLSINDQPVLMKKM